MAIGNRTENKTSVDNNLTATVTIVKHSGMLKDDILESTMFKKDVVDNINAAATGAATADFTSNDQVNVTTTVDIDITVSGLSDGQIGKLSVSKSSTNVVSFTGVNYIDSSISYGLTYMEFLITKSNGFVKAKLINDSVRGFTLSGTPDTGIVILNQYNYIHGRMVKINLSLDVNTSGSTKSIGTLPFIAESSFTGSQYGSVHPTNVIQTEAANCRLGDNGVVYITPGNDNNYYLGIAAII